MTGDWYGRAASGGVIGTSTETEGGANHSGPVLAKSKGEMGTIGFCADTCVDVGGAGGGAGGISGGAGKVCDIEVSLSKVTSGSPEGGTSCAVGAGTLVVVIGVGVGCVGCGGSGGKRQWWLPALPVVPAVSVEPVVETTGEADHLV